MASQWELARGRTLPGAPSLKQLWKESQARGERTYDPGLPCVRGHVSLRWSNSGICIECKRENDNRYNAANKEAHRARSKASAARRPEEVKAYLRAYYRENTDTIKARAKAWEQANPERVRVRNRAWYGINAYRLRPIANAKRAANPDLGRASNRRWKRANPHKVREADSLRRAREVGAAAGNRKAYREYLKWARSAAGLKCYWCRKLVKIGNRHIDHIVPLAKGGIDGVENLCVACPPCNQTKSAKLPFEFAGQAEMAFS